MLDLGLGLTSQVGKGPGGGALIVSDSFDRANSATTLGTSDSGHLWTTHVGTWGIETNLAYVETSAPFAQATVESGVADVEVSVVLAVSSGDPYGLTARRTDANNWIRLVQFGNVVLLQKNVAGSFSTIGSEASTEANGTILMLRAVGDALTVFVNGGELFSATDAHNETATRHGLHGESLTARFNTFTVRAA